MSHFPVQCCFCGHEIQPRRDALTLTLALEDEGSQFLWAHANCLRSHLHESVPLALCDEEEGTDEN